MFSIRSLEYEEQYYHPESEMKRHWKLTGLRFYPFTVIAGLNGAGKTRTCNVIRNTILKIIQPSKPLQLGNTDLTIEVSENESYRILINIEEDDVHKRAIKKEEVYVTSKMGGTLFFDKETLLFNRERIFDTQLRDYISYSPPDDSLTFHVRRDKLSYPYLEEIIGEMKHFYFLDFEESKMIFAGEILKQRLPINILPSYTPMVFEKMVNEDKKKEIIEDINSLGFPIKDMFVRPVILEGQRVPMLYFEEKGVRGPYNFPEASSGMVKVIFLIVFLHLIEEGSCILIDNAGDGLDYKRSINILPIVEKMAGDRQIIISTNNEILLNQTDMRSWNILYRDGSTVRAYNYENSKEQLTRFAETGLSNYEYFQGGYFLK
jgi:ABC-type Na+ transport system ATPase subunit NatA